MELQVDKNILKPNSFIDEYNKELLKRISNNNFDLYYAKDIIIYLLILYKDTGSNFYKTLILKINDEYMKNYKRYTFNNSFWYGHSSYLYILNKMHEYGIIKDGNFNSYKNILLENISDIVNGNFIQNHRWYDLFNGLNGNLIFLLQYDDIQIKKEVCIVVDYIVSELNKLSLNQDNIFVIYEENYIDKKMKEIFNENYLDLGVAHGLINVLQILYKIYRKYNYSQAKNGMNILIDFYYNLMLRFDGKIDSLERISSDKNITYAGDKNIYRWGNGVQTTIIYLTYYCKLIGNKKYNFFEKMINIESLKRDISNLNETKAFIDGVSGYIFNYCLILDTVNKYDEENKLKIYKILNQLLENFEFTDNFSLMEGNLSPVICMAFFSNEIIFEILGF